MTGPVAILIGPPGAGKSTVGPLLAGLLGAEFLDTDAVVEEAAGKPVSDIFISDGEAAFRELERGPPWPRTVASHRGILALGGGAVMDPGTRQLLAGQPRGLPGDRLRRRRAPDRPGRAPPAADRQPARAGCGNCWRSGCRSTRGWPGSR